MSHWSQRIVAIVAAFLIVAQLPAQDKAASNDTPLGQQTFSVCTGCHGLDGAGGEHAPNIATDPNVQRMSDSALLAIIKNGIPASGMPGFSKVLNDQQIRTVLTYLRTLQGNRSNASVPGNAKNGREVFFGRGGCAECHMINGRGGFLAADLSDYGKAHSPASIREAIVSPNQNLDPRRRTVTVATKSGKTYRGVLRNQDNFSLQMQTVDGVFHFFDKRDLARFDYEPTSLMPSDYATKLTKSEIDDLAGFLSQAAGRQEKQKDEEDE